MWEKRDSESQSLIKNDLFERKAVPNCLGSNSYGILWSFSVKNDLQTSRVSEFNEFNPRFPWNPRLLWFVCPIKNPSHQQIFQLTNHLQPSCGNRSSPRAWSASPSSPVFQRQRTGSSASECWFRCWLKNSEAKEEYSEWPEWHKVSFVEEWFMIMDKNKGKILVNWC